MSTQQRVNLRWELLYKFVKAQKLLWQVEIELLKDRIRAHPKKIFTPNEAEVLESLLDNPRSSNDANVELLENNTRKLQESAGTGED